MYVFIPKNKLAVMLVYSTQLCASVAELLAVCLPAVSMHVHM